MADSNLANITLLQEQAQARLGLQLQVIDALDTKLGAFLSIGVALVVTVAGVMAIDAGKLSTWIAVPILAMVLSFAVLLVCSMIALRAQLWRIGAELREVESSLMQVGEEMTRRRLTRTIFQAIEVFAPALLWLTHEPDTIPDPRILGDNTPML